MGVEVRQLTKIYDKSVKGLDRVTLQADSGVLGLLGPNGAGKTTLMRILATLLDPTSGSASIEGYDVQRRRKEIRRILGYLPQTFGLYPQMTCVEFLDYIGLLYGLSAKERKTAIERTVFQVHIEDFASKRIRALSGGMKQRLGIAQAVLTEPRLLIVDEPTTGLDPEERIRIRNLIGELALNRVVILSTHIVGDVSAGASKMALIRKGSVIFHGSPSELLKEAVGRVWLAKATEAQLDRLKRSCPVTNVIQTPEGAEVRFLAESPDGPGDLDGAVSVEPSLEDAYIWKMGASEVEGALS